jgi:hypothetical protein
VDILSKPPVIHDRTVETSKNPKINKKAAAVSTAAAFFGSAGAG